MAITTLTYKLYNNPDTVLGKIDAYLCSEGYEYSTIHETAAYVKEISAINGKIVISFENSQEQLSVRTWAELKDPQTKEIKGCCLAELTDPVDIALKNLWKKHLNKIANIANEPSSINGFISKSPDASTPNASASSSRFVGTASAARNATQDSGSIIQQNATAVMVIGIIIAAIESILVWVALGSTYMDGAAVFFIGLIPLGLGIFLSWIVKLIIEALGKIVENTERSALYLKSISHSDTPKK